VARRRVVVADRCASQNVVDVWSGSMVDPVSHLQFLSLVRHVQKEVPERLRMIGHWLWCLRNTADPTSTRAQAQTLEVGGNGNRGGAGREKNKRRKKDGATGMGTTGLTARGAASHGGHQPQPAVQGVHKIDVASRIEKWRIKSSLLSTRATSKALSEPVGGFLSTIT